VTDGPGTRQGAGRLVNVTIRQMAQEARLSVATLQALQSNLPTIVLYCIFEKCRFNSLNIDNYGGPFAGYRAGRRILQLNPRRTAVFAANDSMAIGALYALQEARIRVPVEIALAGFDDIPMSRFILPPLTTVRVSIAELGTCAIERLIYGIHKKHKHRRRHETLPTSIVVRKSCGASLNNESNSSGIRASPSKRTQGQKKIVLHGN
jgi:hypothetical protein